MVLSAAGASGRAVDALVDAQVNGQVVASTGNGSLHHALKDALLRASERGVRVVKGNPLRPGSVLGRGFGDFPSYAGLSPIKARVALLLDLFAERALRIPAFDLCRRGLRCLATALYLLFDSQGF